MVYHAREKTPLGIKEAKIKFIVDVATKLFLERGIFAVTMRDIAKEAELGEATLYRYFSRKQNLVVAAAMKLENEVFRQYFSLVGQNGFEKLQSFYFAYLKVFEKHAEYYKFVSEFDFYVASVDVDLSGYEKSLFPYYEQYLSAYESGVADGTVKKVADVEVYYLTTTHALISLCKKLTVSGDILSQDKYGAEEVATLVGIILSDLNLRV